METMHFQPLKEGYRACSAGFALRKNYKRRNNADVVYEFINWSNLSGLAIMLVTIILTDLGLYY